MIAEEQQERGLRTKLDCYRAVSSGTGQWVAFTTSIDRVSWLHYFWEQRHGTDSNHVDRRHGKYTDFLLRPGFGIGIEMEISGLCTLLSSMLTSQPMKLLEIGDIPLVRGQVQPNPSVKRASLLKISSQPTT